MIELFLWLGCTAFEMPQTMGYESNFWFHLLFCVWLTFITAVEVCMDLHHYHFIDSTIASDSTNVTRFTAEPGEYTIQLTVEDTYGTTTSGEKTVNVSTEPNTAPEVVIEVYQED